MFCQYLNVLLLELKYLGIQPNTAQDTFGDCIHMPYISQGYGWRTFTVTNHILGYGLLLGYIWPVTPVLSASMAFIVICNFNRPKFSFSTRKLAKPVMSLQLYVERY